MRNTTLGLSICLVLVALVLGGCATTRSAPSTRRITVAFEEPIEVRAPKHEPQTPGEWVLTALFYEKTGRYDEAAEAFRAAADRVAPNIEFARLSLAAAALCALMGGDRDGFDSDVRRLRAGYTRWELMESEKMDKRIRTIFRLHDRLTTLTPPTSP